MVVRVEVGRRRVERAVESLCDCGAPTVAVGVCEQVRSSGSRLVALLPLCARCAAEADAGMRVVWLAAETAPG